MAKHPKRPRDPNQLAKLILDMTTGERANDSPKGPESPATAARRKGGVKGGKRRARRLTADQRREIAQTAARARWEKGKSSAPLGYFAIRNRSATSSVKSRTSCTAEYSPLTMSL